MNPANAWLWYLGAGIGGACGLMLLAWALCSDRRRGQRRCPRCWYEMGAVPSLRCSECGHEAANETNLRRTRRRWGIAALAAALLLGAAGMWAWPLLSRGAHWAWLPTGALIRTRPIARVMPQAAIVAYVGALEARALSPQHYDLLTRQLADIYLDPAAGPRSSALSYWFSHYHLVDGRIKRAGPRGFPRLDATLQDHPYSVLGPVTARQLVDALVCRWRSDPGVVGWELDLAILARANPAAANYMLDRLFAEPVEWALYLPRPTGAGGEAMKRYLAALSGSDAVARARAATGLGEHFFDVNVFEKPGGQMAWIVEQYPTHEDLVRLAVPAGDALLADALGDDSARALAGGRSLGKLGLLFQPQMAKLGEHRDRLDPVVVTALDELRLLLDLAAQEARNRR